MGLIKAPITALGFCGGYLVSGVGSFIKAYSVSSRKIVFAQQILRHHNVHGLKFLTVENERYMVVYGALELCVCKVLLSQNEESFSVSIISTLKTKDWIWDVTFIFEPNRDSREFPECIALVLGHNTVMLYNWKQNATVTESQCEESCFMYSAHFVNEERPTWDSLTLCGGTVFHQVVIWKPGSVNNASSRAKVLERIDAHDGVIFSMSFDFHSGLLVTTSDDRSIRLWTCESLQRFCSKPLSCSDALPTKCLSKLYGHESRVWRARFIHHGEKLCLVSIGEDGRCIVWEITRLEGGTSLDGKILRKTRDHKGNVWSLAIDQMEGHIATGGGDVGIRLWSLCNLLDDNVTITRHPIGESMLPDLSNLAKGPGALKSIHMCKENAILGHTDAGILLRFNNQNCAWSFLHYDDNFKSYAIMSVCDEAYIVALGNTKGELCLLCFDESWSRIVCKSTFRVTSSKGKVHNMTWCMHDDLPKLFVSGPCGELACFQINLDSATCPEKMLSSVKLHSWILPLAKHRWHMGAVFVDHNNSTYVMCGDRRGSLHLFKQGVHEALHTLHGVHEKNGVTSVQYIGKSIISTGRDGIWRKLDVDFSLDNIKVAAQNRAEQGMDWIESAICSNSNTDGLAILGFHGRNFTAWSSVTGDTLLSVECGGGHRDWSFKIENAKSYLAYIKESTLHLAKVPHDVTKEASVFVPHFHGGHITSVKYVDSYYDISSQQAVAFLATGSEDTKVFISAFLAPKQGAAELRRICLIDDHISSVRALAVVNVENNDHHSVKVLFSGGGRATINCYLVKIAKDRCWAESCDIESLASHSLNAKAEKNKFKGSHSTDPEARYMALTAWKEGDNVLLAAACSDAVVRIFCLDFTTNEMNLIAQSSTYSHCFLTIKHFKVEEATFIVAGATDGHVRVWVADDLAARDTTVLHLPCFETKVHMSGINAMDVLEGPASFLCEKDSSSTVLLGTGGDDNAIHLQILKFLNNKVEALSRVCIEEAHSAQVTGLKLKPSEFTDGVELVSTSIDQRLVKWKVSFKENTLECKLLSSVLTDIADISSLEVWRAGTVKSDKSHVYGGSDVCYAVCGEEIQIFDTELK